MSLSYNQQQFLEMLDSGLEIKAHKSKNGLCVKGIINVNSTLYLTLTFRSLLKNGCILVDNENRTLLTEKGCRYLNNARNKRPKEEIFIPT